MRAPYLVVRFLYFYTYFSLKYVHVRYSRQSDTDIYLASLQYNARAGLPQQRGPITVSPYYLTHPITMAIQPRFRV